MKTRIRLTLPILTAVATVAFLGFASQGNAQTSDRLAASPKLQQILNERGAPMNKSASKAVVSTKSAGYQAVGSDGIAASPKYRQLRNEEYAQVDAQLNYPQVAAGKSAGYQAVSDDGIAASPKTRQLLNEQAQRTTQIAPLK